DKKTMGQRLKQVFVLLDVDFLGERPSTNLSPQTYLHPDLTGEDRLRFWLRYLTAIQFDAWADDLRRAWQPKPPRAAIGTPKSPPVQLAALGAWAAPVEAPIELDRVTVRIEYQRHLAMLRRFAELCRDHGTELTIAISPLHRAVVSTLDRQDLALAVTDVSRI